MGLQHIYFLGNLLGHLFNGILVRPSGNGIFMYPLDGGGRYIQTLDVYLPAGKHSRHLIQQTGKVFRMNNDSI